MDIHTYAGYMKQSGMDFEVDRTVYIDTSAIRFSPLWSGKNWQLDTVTDTETTSSKLSQWDQGSEHDQFMEVALNWLYSYIERLPRHLCRLP